MARKLDEVIELDFEKYRGVTNKWMTVGMIIGAQRFGAKISKLPEWLQEKVRAAQEEEREEQQFREIKFLT
jgi:hypothetical protein